MFVSGLCECVHDSDSSLTLPELDASASLALICVKSEDERN